MAVSPNWKSAYNKTAVMQDDLGTDGIGPGCRELGRVKDPQPLLGHDGKARKGFEYN